MQRSLEHSEPLTPAISILRMPLEETGILHILSLKDRTTSLVRVCFLPDSFSVCFVWYLEET